MRHANLWRHLRQADWVQIMESETNCQLPWRVYSHSPSRVYSASRSPASLSPRQSLNFIVAHARSRCSKRLSIFQPSTASIRLRRRKESCYAAAVCIQSASLPTSQPSAAVLAPLLHNDCASAKERQRPASRMSHRRRRYERQRLPLPRRRAICEVHIHSAWYVLRGRGRPYLRAHPAR